MRKAMKLFVVVDSSGAIVKGDDGRPLYFDDKQKAKAKRDEGDYTVAPGPDHHKYNGKDATNAQ